MRSRRLPFAAPFVALALSSCSVAGDSRYLQFDWSAKVDGRPVSVSHVVECMTERTTSPNAFDLSSRSRFVPRQRNAVIDLPDGSRLYVEHGDICGLGGMTPDFDPQNFTPVVLRWFRHERVPRIEVYYSKAYYASPGARITDVQASAVPVTDGPTAKGRKLAPCPDVDPIYPLAVQICRTRSYEGSSPAEWYYAQQVDLKGGEHDNRKRDLVEFFRQMAHIGWITEKHRDIEMAASTVPASELVRLAGTSRPLLPEDDACGVQPEGPVGYLVLRRIPSHRFENYCRQIELKGGKPGSAKAGAASDVIWGNWVPFA